MATTGGARSDSQLRADAALLRPLLADLGGLLAVQIGASAHPCFEETRFATVVTVEAGAAAAGVRARAHALPLPSSSADAVLLMHALETTGERAAVMREAARVLRGEGRLIVAGPRPLAPANLAAWWRGMRPMTGWRVRALMTANGLAWQGRRRLGPLYVAEGVRRIYGVTPLRPAWAGAARRRRGTVGVPGAGHAG